MLRRARKSIVTRLNLDLLSEHRVVGLRVAQVPRHRHIGDGDEAQAGVAKPLDLRSEDFLDRRAHAFGTGVRAGAGHASSGESTLTDAPSSSTPGCVSTRRSTSFNIRFTWNAVSAMTDTPTVARWRRF